MAISRKKVLQKIAGLRKCLDYHLDDHIPKLIGKADAALVEYWKKELAARTNTMMMWAQRLKKNDHLISEIKEYRRRYAIILDGRLDELGDR